MEDDPKLWAAWNGEAPEGADQTRSAFDLKLAGALRRHGFSLQDFATLARWWPYGKSADGDARHWRRTWEKAKPSGPEKPNPEEEARRIAEQIKAQIISWPALAGRQAPPRRFILPDWIPALCVTLLHGFGGVGKSLLAQMLGTTAILKCQFLGSIADACPVLGWWGEDDHDEIWRRQENINTALGIASLADLEGKLLWRPCPGDDLTMFTAANESDFRITPVFKVLREQILDLKIRLAILDSATQVAAIPENNRPLVTRCLQALTNLCLEADTTILLLGHNNREGDYSGSSAWENRARSRIHMKREKDEDGTESIRLARPKANYAALEEGVTLEWHNGAYRCTDHRFETYGDRLDRECREREIDQVFLAALDRLTEQRLTTSASKNSSNYAPKVMAANDGAGGFAQRDLEKAMNRLFAKGSWSEKSISGAEATDIGPSGLVGKSHDPRMRVTVRSGVSPYGRRHTRAQLRHGASRCALVFKNNQSATKEGVKRNSLRTSLAATVLPSHSHPAGDSDRAPVRSTVCRRRSIIPEISTSYDLACVASRRLVAHV